MPITEFLVSSENSNESPRQQLFENLDDAVEAPHCKNIIIIIIIIRQVFK